MIRKNGLTDFRFHLSDEVKPSVCRALPHELAGLIDPFPIIVGMHASRANIQIFGHGRCMNQFENRLIQLPTPAERDQLLSLTETAFCCSAA